MAGLTIFALAGLFGCALAAPAPAPEPCYPTGYTPNTIQSFFYSMEMYQSYNWSYYEADICLAYGIDVPPYIPTCWYDDFDRMALQAKCEYIKYCNSMYPMNYGPNIYDMTVDQLTVDYLLIGGSPSTLTLMTYLLEAGYTVGILDSGYMAPPQCRSPYYAPSLLGSPYVNRIPTYIPGCSQPKYFITPNIFGGIPMIESNIWIHGGQSYYQQMAQFSSYFDYSNVMSRFSTFEYCQTTTETTTSFSSNSFGMSYYTYTKETTVTTSISSWYSDLGYNGFSPFDDCYNPGLYTMSNIGSDGMYSLYIEEIFSRLSSFDRLFLFLGVQIERLIYECGIITGAEVMTPYGPKIIYCRNDVIFGSNTIDMFKLLTKSGIGSPTYMNRFGITPQVELPALGTGFRCMPTFVCPFVLLPKFSLVPEYINDYSAMSFMYNTQNYMSSFDSLSNYRAFMNVGGCSYSNAMYEFYAFNSLMTSRLDYILNYKFQLTIEQIEYIRSCLNQYDVLFITTTLLESSSIGYLEFGETVEDVIIQSQLYSDQLDVTYMSEAIMYLQQIFETSSFMSSGAQIQFLSSMGPMSMSSFFNTNSLQSLLSTYSYLNFQSSGGAIMGNSMTNSVVNNNFNFYNVANLFALNSGISPYSVPYSTLGFNTLLGNFCYDIIQERINSNFYEQMRSADFYNNMINSNMGGIGSNIGGINNMGTRGLNNMGTNTLGVDTYGMDTMGMSGIDTMGGMNTVGMNTMGYNNMGGLNTMGETVLESESMLEMESMSSSGGLLNTSGIGGVGGYGSSMSSYSETEMEMAMGSSSYGGLGSVQGSSYMSTEMESSSTMVGGGGLYGGGSSMVSEFEMAAESSSTMSASSGGCGGGSFYSQQEMEMEMEMESSSNVMVC